MFSNIKIFLILIFSILNLSNSNANEIYYEDWSGIYYLKKLHDNRTVKHPDFRHFTEDTNYILISTWKGKLIFQARIKTMRPLRYGYFDSEIKFPTKRKQTLIEDKCRVEIILIKNILNVDMKSVQDCNSAINISGKYIRYTHKNKF